MAERREWAKKLRGENFKWFLVPAICKTTHMGSVRIMIYIKWNQEDFQHALKCPFMTMSVCKRSWVLSSFYSSPAFFSALCGFITSTWKASPTPPNRIVNRLHVPNIRNFPSLGFYYSCLNRNTENCSLAGFGELLKLHPDCWLSPNPPTHPTQHEWK